MKFVLGLAAAVAFGALGAVATPTASLAKSGSTMETGSNASGGMKSGSMSSGKMSGSKMNSRKMKKKNM